MKISRCLIFLMSFAMSSSCRARPRYDILQRSADITHLADAAFRLPDAVVTALMHMGYLWSFADQQQILLSTVSDGELVSRFDATTTAAFFTMNDREIADSRKLLAELEHRRVASNEQLVREYRLLVSCRRFSEANDLASRYSLPGMEVITAVTKPELFASEQPTELVLDLDTHKLVRRAAQLDSTVQIIALGHPSCHFSQDAMRDIVADPVLREISSSPWAGDFIGLSRFRVADDHAMGNSGFLLSEGWRRACKGIWLAAWWKKAPARRCSTRNRPDVATS